MEKKYKSIIFDLDGTLIDSEKINAIALLELLAKKANMTHLTLKDVTPKMGQTGANILREFGIAEQDISEYLNDWIEYVYNESQKPIELFEGVLTLLEELKKRGVPIGIVSSKTKEIFDIEQKHLNITHYFDHIVLADDTDYHKPHPAPLQHYLQLSKLQADDCIYIGDAYTDLVCARENNMDFGYAGWGTVSPLLKQETEIYKFETVESILELV